MNAKSIFPVLLLVLLIAGSAVYWVEAPMAPSVQALQLKAGTLLSQPRTLPDVILKASDGSDKFSHDYAGKWTLLFAGYTHCPDVCPTTMSDLNRVSQLLLQQGIDPQKFRILFLSIDPERDTAEKLRDFARYFNPAFEAVTAKPSDLEVFTKALGVVYLKIPADKASPADKYVMDHSTAVLLLDPAFRFAGLFSAPHDPQAIADDLVKILAVYPDVKG